jgi:protein TonB
MTATEKKSKRKGIIGTILFHVLLLVAFLFMGLTYQDPPPAEEGISINFGFTDEGLGEIEPEDTEEIIDPVEEEIIEEQIESTEEIVTQTTIETPAVEKTEEKKKVVEKEQPKEEVIEEKKQEVDKTKLYLGKKETKTTSEGDNNGDGNQGVIDGDPNADAYEGGGIGEDGTAYQLGDRKPTVKPEPQGNQVIGKVFVAITVDRLGNVINAIPGVQGSTTQDQKLLERAKTAALKWKYEPNPNGPETQSGKIIFDFSLD